METRIPVKKKFVSVLLTGVLALSLSSSAYATTNIGENTPAQNAANAQIVLMKEEINKLMAELSQITVNNLLEDVNAEAQSKSVVRNENNDETRVAEIKEALKSLGLKEITAAEALSTSETVSPQGIVVPGDSANVDWSELNYTSYVGGKTYQLQEVYARGKGYNTNLYRGGEGVSILDEPLKFNQHVSKMAWLYAEKAIGATLSSVPIVAWAPWELLMPTDDYHATVDSHTVGYRSQSTVCFTYVKTAGQTEQLALISNMFTLASSQTFHGLKGDGNGLVFPHNTQDVVVYSDLYADGFAAVDSYVDIYAPNVSFARSFTFYNFDKSQNHTRAVVLPIGPGSITGI